MSTSHPCIHSLFRSSGMLRAASHAGDWYTDDGGCAHCQSGIMPYRLSGQQLDAELSAWLKDVDPTDTRFPVEGCKAIIAPFVLYILSLHPHG